MMSDITICMNEYCKFKEKCYRYNAKVSELYQSYALFCNDHDNCFKKNDKNLKKLSK